MHDFSRCGLPICPKEGLLDTPSPTWLLLKICGLAAATSAVLTNDTTCLMLTPLVLKPGITGF